MSNLITVLIGILGSGVNRMTTTKSFFMTAQTHVRQWTEKETYRLPQSDIDFIEDAFVVPGNFGPSVRCLRKDGLDTYVSIDVDNSRFLMNQHIDLTKAEMVVLTDGRREITKIRVGLE